MSFVRSFAIFVWKTIGVAALVLVLTYGFAVALPRGADDGLVQPLDFVRGLHLDRNGRPIIGRFGDAASLTLSLTGIALLLTLPAAALVATFGARRPAAAALIRTLVVIGSSVPAVALAPLAQREASASIWLGGLVLGLCDLGLAALCSPVSRAYRRETEESWVLALRARSIGPARYTLRRLLVFLASTARARLPVLLGGAIVVERVFSFDQVGLASLVFEAVKNPDPTVILWFALLAVVLVRLTAGLEEGLRGLLTPRAATLVETSVADELDDESSIEEEEEEEEEEAEEDEEARERRLRRRRRRSIGNETVRYGQPDFGNVRDSRIRKAKKKRDPAPEAKPTGATPKRTGPPLDVAPLGESEDDLEALPVIAPTRRAEELAEAAKREQHEPEEPDAAARADAEAEASASDGDEPADEAEPDEPDRPGLSSEERERLEQLETDVELVPATADPATPAAVSFGGEAPEAADAPEDEPAEIGTGSDSSDSDSDPDSDSGSDDDDSDDADADASPSEAPATAPADAPPTAATRAGVRADQKGVRSLFKKSEERPAAGPGASQSGKTTQRRLRTLLTRDTAPDTPIASPPGAGAPELDDDEPSDELTQTPAPEEPVPAPLSPAEAKDSEDDLAAPEGVSDDLIPEGISDDLIPAAPDDLEDDLEEVEAGAPKRPPPFNPFAPPPPRPSAPTRPRHSPPPPPLTYELPELEPEPEAPPARARASREALIERAFLILLGIPILLVLGLGIAGAWPHDLDVEPTAEQFDAAPDFAARSFLGRNSEGEDVASLCLRSVRTTAGPLALATALALLVGTVLGAGWGFASRWSPGHLAGLLVETLDAVPRLLIVLAAVALFETDGYLWKVLPVTGLSLAPLVAHPVRAAVADLADRPFIEALRALGVSRAGILFRHILWNNARGPALMATAEAAAFLVLFDVTLGYLGYTQPDPDNLSLGGLLERGLKDAYSAAGSARATNPLALWGPLAVAVAAVAAAAVLAERIRTRMEEARARW